MNKFILGRDMADCPIAWRNFIRSIPIRDEQGAVPEKVARKELKKFNAYVRRKYDYYRYTKTRIWQGRYTVTFKTERDYMLFFLTY